MTQHLMKYNPAFLTDEELAASFVIRNVDLQFVLETIRDNINTASNQHLLIVGPRGMGKTTLVLRAASEVRNDPNLSEYWYPLAFGEEAYEVCTPGEFWLETIFHLGEQTKEPRWQQAFKSLRAEKDEQRLRERALAQLLDFADEQGKHILVIVENLNMLLTQQMDSRDTWVLRETLLNEPRIMLLATATSRFEEIDNADQAMYELFRILDLKPLDADGCKAFWASITKEELSNKQIRPIQILTGGNPRLLAIIAHFAAKSSFLELMTDLTKLVDDHTDYFKSHLECLPPQERKVFVALADLWDPSTTSEVAETARMPVNAVSTLLLRLANKGAVSVVDEQGGKKIYQITERMYNIYHLMRRRGQPSARVEAVVRFMVHFYEIDDFAKRIADEYCRLPHEQCDYHVRAYEAILNYTKSSQLQRKVLAAAPQRMIESINIGKLTSDKKSHALASGEQHLSIMQDNATKDIDEEPTALLKQARSFAEQANYEEAEQAYRKAIELEPDYAFAWAMLGELLHEEMQRYEEAEQAYRKAIELKPDFEWAWAMLGALLHEKMQRYEEAEQAYRKAIELEPDDSWDWAVLGALLHERMQRYEEAEQAYRKAIELKPDFEWAWAHLGALLHEKMQRYEEAEQAYRKAIELKPDFEWAWAQLGKLLHKNMQRYEEAEQAYRKAIELKPDFEWAWIALGKLLHEEMQRYEEAEQAYRKAIELKPDYEWAWVQLGQLLHEKMQRYEEAEQAYRKAIELKPDYEWAWAMLGELLHEEMQRYEEAEQAYRKAIELKPDFEWAWAMLGQLLHEERQRYEEAEQAYRKAIELKPDYEWAWVQLGQLLHEKMQRYEEAEQAYRKAIELEPDYRMPWGQLCVLLLNTNRIEEAYKLAVKYIERSNRSPEALNEFAWRFYDTDDFLYLGEAELWAREAVEKGSADANCYLHTLASILAKRKKWTESLDAASSFLSDAEWVTAWSSDVVDFVITIAAAGHGKEILYRIKQSPSCDTLEPLVCGLRLYLGEKVTVAQEINEVAKDIVKQIEERKKELTEAE